MEHLKIGDIVARKSYDCDILFRVDGITNQGEDKVCTLKGITYRIQADAFESDLIVQPESKAAEYKKKSFAEAYRNLQHAGEF